MQKVKTGNRAGKFILVGSFSALLDIVVVIVLVEIVGLPGYWGKNLANAAGMETGSVCAFMLNRGWTWKDADKKRGRELLRQFMFYHVPLLFGILMRVVLFAILEAFGIPYLLSILLAIGMAAVVNFFFFDRLVFRGVYSISAR